MSPIDDPVHGSIPSPADADAGADAAPAPLGLVVDLCQALDRAGVRYCHWKSNEAIDRSARGENDLDLLVDRADADRFGQELCRLGFKQARPAVSREVPGLIDHYGLDQTGRLVHLQAHYQLVLGDDMTKNFRLPVEQLYLASSRSNGLFPLPSPKFELALFIVRMVLKHASWDAQASLQGALSSSEEREFAYLREQVGTCDRAEIVAAHLPFVTYDLASSCLLVVESGANRRTRASVARELERRLVAHARRPRGVDIVLRTSRRGARLAARALGRPARKRLVAGGSLIGVAGTDRAATSSVVDGLVAWLGAAFPVRRFDCLDSAGRWSGDALHAARRHATNGGISVCAQMPPGAASPQDHHGAWSPDVLLQLRTPDDVVAPPPSALVLDGTRALEEILAEARTIVWARL